MATGTATSRYRREVSQSRIKNLQQPVQALFHLMTSDTKGLRFSRLLTLTHQITAAAQEIADQNIPHGCPSTACQEISRMLDAVCQAIEAQQANPRRWKWQGLVPPLVAAQAQVDLLIAARARLDSVYHPRIRAFPRARVGA